MILLQCLDDLLGPTTKAADVDSPIEPDRLGEETCLVVRMLADRQLQPIGDAVVANGPRSEGLEENADILEDGHGVTHRSSAPPPYIESGKAEEISSARFEGVVPPTVALSMSLPLQGPLLNTTRRISDFGFASSLNFLLPH
jgi:hypothetical protein